MEIINKKIDRKKLDDNIISKDTCFFDIETTGFNRNSDIVYLIGILYFNKEKDSWIVSQYFANDLKDEPKVILEATKTLMTFKTIINYNGNSFDIPFINNKLKTFKLPVKLDPSKSLDLYSFIRKNKRFLETENLKLKSLEEYLGIYRADIYSGKDCIKFYKDYILTGDLELKKRLLKHNFEDLYYLIDILDIIDIINEKKSFKLYRENKTIKFLLEDMRSYRDKLIFKGNIEGLDKKLIYYENNFNVIIEDTSKFKITILANEGLISPDEVCKFVYKSELNIVNELEPNHGYEISDEIFLLKIESNFLLDDILILLREIMNNII